tara:strand:- start:1074 stop:1709 length:636 start_codon:yes stop_codon:yes gene_type:complete
MLIAFIGGFIGFILKLIINWVDIDRLKIDKSNFFIEIISAILWLWAFHNLSIEEGIVFSLIASVLVAIGFVDFFTMQIPLILILIGFIISVSGIFIGTIYFTASLWGIFVGGVIPLMIMGVTYIFTKRQGMGYGDIQLGIILGAWLGPMRMALTLFAASLLSLLTWIAVSLIKEFDKNRAMPLAPFLAIAGIGVYIGSVYYPGLFHLLIIE